MESFSQGCVSARLTELKLFQDYMARSGRERTFSGNFARYHVESIWINTERRPRTLVAKSVYTLAISPAPAAIFCR